MDAPSWIARRRRAIATGNLAAILVIAAAAGACGPPERQPWPARKPTPGKASLPATPELHPPATPPQYDDGAWSIHGALGSATAGRGDESIAVRGYVAVAVPCADRAAGCKQAPHLWLADREDLQGRRLLVGGFFDPERDGIAVTKQVTVRGKIRSASPDGTYFSPSGVLLLDQPPPPADVDGGPRGP